MNDDLIIQALGGKPGDVLVRNPDGSATLQEGPKPSNPSVTNQLDMIGQAANNALNAFGLGAAYDTAKGAVDVAQGKDTLGNKLNAGLLGFRQGVLPAGGAVAGGMAGAKVPGPPLVKIIGGLVGSIAGGIGAGRAQDVVQKEFFPQASAEYEQAAQQFPWSTRIGGLVPSALTGRFGLDNVKSVARVARNVARTSPTVALREAVASGDAANAINAAAGVGIPTAAAYNQYKATGEFDPSVVLDVAAGVGQTGFNKPLSKALGIPYGPAYQAQTAEQLRQGLDKLAPLNVDTAQLNPYDIPLASEVSKDAIEMGITEPDKLAADMGKGREKAYATGKANVSTMEETLPPLDKQPIADQRKMEAQRIAAQKQLEEAELNRRTDYERTQLGRTAADVGRNPSIKPEDIANILHAEGLTDAEKLAKLQGLTAPTIENRYTPDAPHTPIVPDNPATVQQQLELALDPASARKAVLLTPGTQMPGQLPVRLRSVETPHGEVVYNPDKISLKEIYAAAQGDEFDARILGMSQFSKPGDPEAVAVTTARKNQPNVQAEAAAGEGIPAAVAAAEKANPGEPVSIKPPEQVLEERQQPGLSGDDVNLSAKGYGEDEIAGRVGDKRANLLGGISRSLEAGGHEVTVQPTENLYTTPEDSRPRFGLQSGNRVEYGTSAHAAPHEAVHAIYEGLPKSEQARLDAAVTRSPEFQRAVADDPGLTPKEFLAQRGSVELVRQIQEKDFGLWRDLAMQVRRMFNMDTPQDAMRFINNAFTAGADRPGGSLNVNQPKPLKQVGPTYQRFPGYDKAKGVFAKEVETNAKGANVPKAVEPETDPEVNYSTPVKGPKVPDDFKTSDVRGFSLIDRISNAPLRQSANEAQAEKSRLLGYGYKAVRDNKAALKEADLDKMADAFNGKAPPLTDPASQAVYKMFRTAADWINSNGPARQITPKNGYVPQMFHPEVRQVFKDAVNSPDAKAIKAALVAHYQKAMSRSEAVKAVDELATAIHTNPSYDPSTDFGPLHKAAGMGLPAEVAAPSGVIRIRDNDMLRVAQTYFARAATDLAYHNAITKRFGANGGELSKGNFQRWRQSFTGQPESDADQLLRSSMRAGSSVVVSTLSGLNNIVAIPQQAMAFTGKYGPFTTAAALIDTITAPRASHEASIAAGHTRPGQNDMTFKQTRDTNLAAAVLDASADTMRLITGSTALENISRAWTYNIGKRAARNMIDAGDHDKMLRLGVQPSDPKAEEKLAASIANHIEGTYDGRELPGPLVEGKLGALLSIHKWSIEKMNSAYKDLYVPATKGDLWPLLWTVAMAAGVTIPAAKELKEAVNRKKGAPELEEINAAEKVTGKKDWLARTAWLTQLLSMASIAGYASQAANAATQTAAGRKDQNLVFVPLSELAGEELSNLVGNASQALRKGEDLDTIGPQFAKDLLKIMVQGSQAVLNRLPGQEANVKAASDNRDLAVYNNLVNKKMPSEARANDLDGALEREFKQEQDPVKAGELLRKIADRYREKFKDDPFMLAAKLRSLREMNGIGFPTEGNEAGRYKQYLDEAYGPEGSSNRVRRAAYRDALNRGKVEALDKGGMKPPPDKPNPFRK